MIQINYMRSFSGNSNCFSLLFPLKEFTSESISEREFYLSLLQIAGYFDGKKEHCHTMIWSVHYDCICDGIPFTMVYDEDYDDITFAIGLENLQQMPKIAEQLQALVESERRACGI